MWCSLMSFPCAQSMHIFLLSVVLPTPGAPSMTTVYLFGAAVTESPLKGSKICSSVIAFFLSTILSTLPVA